jgi:hypothetical protein
MVAGTFLLFKKNLTPYDQKLGTNVVFPLLYKYFLCVKNSLVLPC